jgi:hypothetical protein
VSNKEYDSGSTCLYRFRDLPLWVLVRSDRYIIKVITNIPKLAFSLPHNGRCLRTQKQFDDAITMLQARLRPYVKCVGLLEVSEIELAINVADPVLLLQSFFWGVNIKGSHQCPVIRPGQAVSLNRDRRKDGKRPELSFVLYNKLLELLEKNDYDSFSRLPDNVTRLEFALRASRVEKEFGGKTLDFVTLEAMQNVFWRLFDQLCIDVPTTVQADLTASKPDMLVRMIAQELKFQDLLPESERTFAWWLRSNVESVRKRAETREGATPTKINKAVRDATARANRTYRHAALRANALLGRRLSDYVNPSTPFLEIY